MSDVVVFVCNRGGGKRVKVQLELSIETFNALKEIALRMQITPKLLMENYLTSSAQGVNL